MFQVVRRVELYILAYTRHQLNHSTGDQLKFPTNISNLTLKTKIHILREFLRYHLDLKPGFLGCNFFMGALGSAESFPA